MIITTKIKMDLAFQHVLPCVDVVQNDKYSRKLELSLYENGAAWQIPSGTTVEIRYVKADGKGGNYDTMPDGTDAYAIRGNTVTVALVPQVCTAAGPVRMSVALINGDAEINTFTVRINVQRNPGVEVISEDYYQIMGSAGYYDLDLTDVISFESYAEGKVLEISDSYDWSKVFKAVDDGKLVRMHFMENDNKCESIVLLNDIYFFEGANAYYLQSVYSSHASESAYFKIMLNISYEEKFAAYNALVCFIPVNAGDGGGLTEEQKAKLDVITVTEDGYTDISGLRRLKSWGVVENGNTVTLNYTLEGDESHTDVMTFDENGYPVSIVADGFEIAGTWTVVEEAAGDD